MKTIKKKVTVTKEVYVAEDGTEFEEYDDCENYEIICLEKTIEMYDFKLDKADVDSCIYVKLPTSESVVTFLRVLDYYGISRKGISNPGLYMYDNRHEWINASEIFEKLYPNHKWVEVAE